MKRRIIAVIAATLILSSLLSCGAADVAETTAAEETEESAVSTAAETEPVVYDYASMLPEEFSFVNTDLPQVVIETGHRPDRSWREISVAVLSFSDGKVNVDRDSFAEMRVRGNTSSGTPKRQYSVKLNDKTSLLGMREGRRWVLNGSVFDKSLVRCKLICDFSQKLRLPYSPHGEMCELWLDGEYCGVYLLMEPIADGSGRVDINVDDNDFILEASISRQESGVKYIKTPAVGMRFEYDEPEKPTAEQARWLEDFLADFETALIRGVRDEWSKYVDIGSFVDFYILNELAKDIDFNEFSTRYFIKNGVLYAGPPWDFDLSMGNVSYSEYKYLEYHNDVDENGVESYDMLGDSTQAFWCRTGWYEYMLADEWFRGLVAERWQELLPEITALYEDGGVIDGYKEDYADAMARNWRVWDIYSPYGPYEDQSPLATPVGNIGYLKRWLAKRASWLTEHIGDEGVTPALHRYRAEYNVQ